MRTTSKLIAALVCLAALPGLARKNDLQMGALVLPMDEGAEASAIAVEAYINDALDAYPNVSLKKSDDMLGLPDNEEAKAAFKRLLLGYQESRNAFDSQRYDEAERKLRATLKELPKAAAAMERCVQACDALAMLAACYFYRGDIEEARNTLLHLTSLEPSLELPPKRYRRDFITLRTIVATGKDAITKGTIIIKSRPSGARVYIDGEQVGHTPLTHPTSTVGRHLVRLERPGFVVSGQVVEVLQEETEVTVDLTPTDDFRAFDSLATKIAAEVNKSGSGGGGAVAQLGKRFGLDRAVVAVARQTEDTETTTLQMALFDMRSARKLATRKLSFQGDEFGMLKSEIGKAVTAMVNSLDAPQEATSSSDPLDRKAGIEDWTADDRGGKAGRAEKRKQKKGPGDPLEEKSGMEDW